MMNKKTSDVPLEESIKSIFSGVFQKVSKRVDQPEIHITFYPFAGLNHTIRIRNQHVYVRISDLLQEAPLPVYRALAHILIGKLFKRRANARQEEIYRQYAYQPAILQASDRARQQRGRKHLNGAVGKAYNLDQIFERLNRHYFDDALAKPALSWSLRRTRRILGHHDAIHNAIIISRSLDSKSVPDYVVEYVMYHEMLHIKHKPKIVNERRLVHTPAFRADEQQYTYYVEAVEWIEQLSVRKKR